MPPDIIELSGKLLGSNPERVSVKPEQATAEKVEQAVYFVSKPDKQKLLVHILNEKNVQSTLVFSRTKHGADKIVKILSKADIKAEAIHGNKSQNARQRALGNFKKGTTKVLIATDIAARGIDIEQLSLVVNYDLPNIPETYVHRIGRTGRAKASGISLSFCDAEERAYLRSIQKLINQQVPVVEEHPFHDDSPEPAPAAKKKKQNHQHRNRSNNRQRRDSQNRR